MKIAFDAKRAFLNRSGLGNYSRDIIRSLHDFYPEVSCVLFSPTPQTDLLEEKYRRNVICPATSNSLKASYWRSYKMGNDIATLNPDIYHGLSNELPVNISKSKAIKVVTIHDLIFIKFPQLYSLIDRKIYYRKFYRACKDADKIIATSIQTKEDIIKYFGIDERKIEVVYQSCANNFNGQFDQLELENIREKYSLPNRYVLTVGTVEKRKNALNVIKAIYYFNLDIDYLLVGRKTDYAKEILDWAQEHKISYRLHFVDNISNADLPAIYKMAEVFVYPSIYEGFGIPIIEAFNAGVPVITGDKGATAEVGGKAAIQVDVLNPKNIGVAIKSVCESSDLKFQLISEGIERAELFSRENVTKELYNFYKNL
ncbi:MAG: glycosyltransferase family 1 protein [Bacteroidales bacterium]|nr:glycosyltransferase family 1 protein [Bacteroidales bacterium]